MAQLTSLIADEGNREDEQGQIGLTSTAGKTLLAAVLGNAVREMWDHIRVARKTRKYLKGYEVLRAWFEDDYVSEVFSFASICARLQLEPEYVRRAAYNPRDKKRYMSIVRKGLERKL